MRTLIRSLHTGATPLQRFLFKNLLVILIVCINALAVPVAHLIARVSIVLPGEELRQLGQALSMWLSPTLLFLSALLLYIYEQPVRRWADAVWAGDTLPRAERRRAQRRLLNAPFFIVAMGLSLWLLAAVAFTVMFAVNGAPSLFLTLAFIQDAIIGLVTSTMAFFAAEQVLQLHYIPFFFPTGGVSRVRGVLRLTLAARMAALFSACCLIPVLVLLLAVGGAMLGGEDPAETLPRLWNTTRLLALLFLISGAAVIALVRRNLSRPFREILHTLKAIGRGKLHARVTVRSNDELAFTGDAINDMAQGLEERERMRLSLELARSVQQRLLPRDPPDFPGLEMAGLSRYCDETGGDYFDYFTRPHSPGRVVMVLGDVAGHGAHAALLMASVRAALRMRTEMEGTPAQVITAVNNRICLDTDGAGQFMTLFYAELDPIAGSLTWVRAGHDPALLHAAATGDVRELMGEGIPLGVAPGWEYEEQSTPFSPGDLLFMGTDGIWEARDKRGRMFGKTPLLELLRAGGEFDARTVLARIEASVIAHQAGPAVDDMTMVAARRV